MMSISKVAYFVAKVGAEKQLGDELQALIAPTHQEAGVRRYEVFQNLDDPRRWIVQEDWRSVDDFDFHMATPYVTAFLTKVPQLCDAQPEIRSYAKFSPAAATDEVAP